MFSAMVVLNAARLFTLADWISVIPLPSSVAIGVVFLAIAIPP